MLLYTKLHRDWLIDLLGLGFLFIIFYLLLLGHYPLFTPDEGRYSEVAREMVASGDYITPHVNGVVFLDKPVLYYWLQALAILVFGIHEWSLRLFPAFYGIFGCLITYLCGRLLFNRRTAILSAVILATSPVYFCNAHYANLDLEVAVLISAALLFFITGVQNKGPSRPYFILAVYIFSAFAFLTKGMIGIVFPIMIIAAWILVNGYFALLKKIHLFLGLLLFFSIVTPWYIFVQKANPNFFHYFFVTQQITRFLSTAEFNNKMPIWFYLPVILFGFFPWTIFLIQALKQGLNKVFFSRKDCPTETYLLLWSGIIFIFFSIPHSKTIGYILPLLPALALLVGHYLSTLWEKANQPAVQISIVLYVLIGLLLSILLLALPNLNWIEWMPSFKPYVITMAIITSFSAIASLIFLKKQTLAILFMTCVLSNIVFLLTLTLGAAHLNVNSAKLLVLDLKGILQETDEVIVYNKYYHDIPLYLGQRVTVVFNWDSPDIATKDNWARELWSGMHFQNTDDWLINEETFWQRWESNKRIFVFIDVNYLKQFKAHAKSYYVLGKHNDIILLSNKPTVIYALNESIRIVSHRLQWQIPISSKNPDFAYNKSKYWQNGQNNKKGKGIRQMTREKKIK